MTNEQLALLLEEYRLSVMTVLKALAADDAENAIHILGAMDFRLQNAVDTLRGIQRI